jgi:RNA-dependent RNA polymerase
MLLESNGVDKDLFINLQRKAVQEVQLASKDVQKYMELLESYALGHSFGLLSLLRHLSSRKILDFQDIESQDEGLLGFLNRIAKICTAHALRDLKHHARIPVPESYSLVGVADEWDFLEEGEVYGKSTLFEPSYSHSPHLF